MEVLGINVSESSVKEWAEKNKTYILLATIAGGIFDIGFQCGRLHQYRRSPKMIRGPIDIYGDMTVLGPGINAVNEAMNNKNLVICRRGKGR